MVYIYITQDIKKLLINTLIKCSLSYCNITNVKQALYYVNIRVLYVFSIQKVLKQLQKEEKKDFLRTVFKQNIQQVQQY